MNKNKLMERKKISYTRAEELWNSRSHAAGIVLAVAVGTTFIVWAARHENGWAILGTSLYLFGMLGSYVASTVYHAISPTTAQRVRLKERLRLWDHAAIYWHIAGSFSPITLVALRDYGAWGWALFAFVWTAALAGTIASFRRLSAHSNLETICFCLMGLSVLVAFGPLLKCVSPAAVAWIVAEGVCYLTGALFYSMNKRRYMHTVFHFFVLAGSVCHIIAVWDVLAQYFSNFS